MSFMNKGKLTPIAGIAIVVVLGFVVVSFICFDCYLPPYMSVPPEAEFEEQQCEYLKWEAEPAWWETQRTDMEYITWTGQDCVREFPEDQIIEHLDLINGEWEWVER